MPWKKNSMHANCYKQCCQIRYGDKWKSWWRTCTHLGGFPIRYFCKCFAVMQQKPLHTTSWKGFKGEGVWRRDNAGPDLFRSQCSLRQVMRRIIFYMYDKNKLFWYRWFDFMMPCLCLLFLFCFVFSSSTIRHLVWSADCSIGLFICSFIPFCLFRKHECMPQHMCGDQGQLFGVTSLLRLWILKLDLGSLGLGSKCSCVLSHLPGPFSISIFPPQNQNSY